MKPILFPLSLTLALLSACGGGEPPKSAEAAGSAAPVPVKTEAVAAREWPDSYEATGTVRSRTPGIVSSKLMAYVQQVSVQVGDHVREGQVIVTLDARDLDSSVRRAEAARAEVRSGIPEAESGIAAARASLDLAQATHHRIEDLAAKKSVSTQELDEATARLKSAQAAYEMARARRTQLDSKMAQVEQEISSATIMRDYSRIAAPFAGVVTARSVEPGNLAAPRGAAAHHRTRRRVSVGSLGGRIAPAPGEARAGR